MTLSQYYNATDANKSNIFAPAEIGELRASIADFFKGFDEAIKKDCSATGQLALVQVYEPHITQAYLREKQDELKGLGLYLLDFRGFNDEILKEGKFDLKNLTYMVLYYHYPFEEAHFRLLELTDLHSYASYCPEKDNVANYIIDNFHKFNEVEKKRMYDALKKMKKRVESNGLKITDYTYAGILYSMLKKEFSFFKF